MRIVSLVKYANMNMTEVSDVCALTNEEVAVEKAEFVAAATEIVEHLGTLDFDCEPSNGINNLVFLIAEFVARFLIKRDRCEDCKTLLSKADQPLMDLVDRDKEKMWSSVDLSGSNRVVVGLVRFRKGSIFPGPEDGIGQHSLPSEDG
ncbi:hypothetical protein TCAL_14640 [Tigriopus californicus]|uniref:Uncharacterized protein n=1 Tax=Tigriopus californicus TaxID=6832 RepID=A0A553P6F3_TIGCA|nr:hypothetical protein TCAL_14640 [Tigriopus californicus]